MQTTISVRAERSLPGKEIQKVSLFGNEKDDGFPLLESKLSAISLYHISSALHVIIHNSKFLITPPHPTMFHPSIHNFEN